MPGRFFAVLAALILFWAGVSTAEERKDEWVDKTQDFRQIKTVMVEYSLREDIKLSETERQNLSDRFEAVFFKENKKAKVRYISRQQAEQAVEKLSGLNLKELKANGDPQYDAVIQTHLPAVADAVLKITIIDQRYSVRHVPASVTTYTDYEYIYVQEPYTNSWGQTYYVPRTVAVPVTKTRVSPAYDMQVAHAGAEFILSDLKSRRDVWKMLDIREAGFKHPVDMTERIFKRGQDKLNDMVQGKH